MTGPGDISAITIPVAALGPLVAVVNAWLERGKRKTLEGRIDELEKQVKACEEGRAALALKVARRRRRPRKKTS